MKTRVITGTVLIIGLILILWVNIPLIDTIFIAILSLLGIYEYNKAFKSAGYHPIEIYEYLSCLSIFLIGLGINSNVILLLGIVISSLILISIFIFTILKKLKVTVIDVAITVLSIVYIPFLFSFLKLILDMQYGRIFIWFVIMGAFACDTCAYIIGSKFGKRKLCPDISPKKTVEGSIAGIIGAVISYIIIYYISVKMFNLNLNIYVIVIMGIVASIVGQFGDLSASSIKRFCKIKDFGSVLPGHGGILDRCDSILFVAPIVYMFIKLFM